MTEHSDYMRGYFDGEIRAYEQVQQMLNTGLPYYALNECLKQMLETIKELRYPEEKK